MSKGLNELRDEAFRIAKEHGFKDASIGEDIALMHSELSEALEDHRAGKIAHEMQYERAGDGAHMSAESIDHARVLFNNDKLPKPIGIPSEMADAIIRILHFSGKHGIDIEKAVVEKMAYNESRPYLHGGKKL